LVLVCDAATRLALQLHQERTQVVCSNQEAQKRLTELNGKNAMGLAYTNFILK